MTSQEKVANIIEIEKANEEKTNSKANTLDIKTNTTDDTNTASIELAIKITQSKRPSQVDLNTGKLVPYSCCSFKLQQFQQFGVGIYLYFKFLRQLTKLFLFLFVLSLPLLLSSLASGKLEPTPLQFEQTTIGNLGNSEDYDRIYFPDYINFSFLSDYNVDFDTDTNSLHKADAGIIFGWTDLIGTISFLLFLIYVSFKQKKEAKLTEDANTTIGDYTICVKGLPKDCYNREELQHHFQTKNDFGRVVDVAICYNDTGIIKKYLQKSNVSEQRQSAIKKEEKEKKISSLHNKIKKTNQKLYKLQEKYNKYAICAYITFNNAESVSNVLYNYPNTFLARLCMKKSLKFRNKYKLKISSAPEPSEIIYDNMKYSKCNVFLRRSVTFILSFVVIALSCGMSLGAAIYRQNNLQSANDDSSDCLEVTDPLSEINSGNSSTDIDCLCSQLSVSQMTSVSESCSDYIKNMAISNLLIGGSAIIIVVINLALKFISRCLVNFEKHKSLTKMERELTSKIFIGMFFNTALIILCVNAKFEEFDYLLFLFKGSYDDFVPEWYQVVGVSLLLTMTLNIINPHLIPIISYPIQKCMLWCKVRKIRNDKRNSYTQRELNSLFEGTEYTLAERYAILCNTIFVAYFYSSGMPILLLFAAITFLITYYCDKFVLLRNSKIPPKYNSDIAQFTLKLIKPVIYIHLAISIWVYGSTTVLLNHSLRTGIEYEYHTQIQEKALNYSCFPSFLTLVILITFDFTNNILTTFKLKQCFFGIIKKCLLCFCPCICRKLIKGNVVHVQEDIGLFINEINNGQQFESYLTSLQEKYDEAHFNPSMPNDTKGLLIKEQPLYIKQGFVNINNNNILNSI